MLQVQLVHNMQSYLIFVYFFYIVITAEEIQAASSPGKDVTSEEWPTCDKVFLNGKYSVEHKEYCDRFYACSDGVPYLMQCEDGYAYSQYRGCKLRHLVDCNNRTKFQETRGTNECPRLNGLFGDPQGCGLFVSCYNGTANYGRCPNTLIFDNEIKNCRIPSDEEKQKCLQPPVLLGCTIGPDGSNKGSCTWYQCPALNSLPFGDHSRHPYPGHCSFYIKCLADGSIKIESCGQGNAFNEITNLCEPQNNVTNCTSSSSVPAKLN